LSPIVLDGKSTNDLQHLTEVVRRVRAARDRRRIDVFLDVVALQMLDPLGTMLFAPAVQDVPIGPLGCLSKLTSPARMRRQHSP
jgi:hypothetical protein